MHRTAGSYLSLYWVLNNLQRLVFWDSSEPKKVEDIQLQLVLPCGTGDKHRTERFTPGRRKGSKGSLILRNSKCLLGEAHNRGWDGWMASPTQWTLSKLQEFTGWWWTGRPGVLQSMESQRFGHDWVTKLNWISILLTLSAKILEELSLVDQLIRKKRGECSPTAGIVLWNWERKKKKNRKLWLFLQRTRQEIMGTLSSKTLKHTLQGIGLYLHIECFWLYGLVETIP